MLDSVIINRCDKNWILRAALVVLALTFSGTRGLAQEPYLWDFNGTYGTYGSALDTCTLCHPGYPFNITWAPNSFGSDYALEDHAFSQALEAADSDGDGFVNIQEITALTFPGDSTSTPPSVPTLETLSIDGPSSVNEGDTASYEASASWSDGSTATVSASWDVSPATYATIGADGLLTVLQVSADQTVTVSASFEEGDVTATASQSVTITDVPPPADSGVFLFPQDGSDNVSVTTVVVATLNGSGDITTLVNDSTFSLSVDGSGGIVAGSIDYNDGHTEATFTPTDKLAYDTAYTATVTPATGVQQLALASSVSSSFTTIAQCGDADGDGVQDCEDDDPNDPEKATPPSVRGSGKFLVDTYGNAGIALALANTEGISDMCPQFKRQGKPFGYSFPDGLVRYTLTNVSPGGTVTVTVSFPSGVPQGSKVFKVDGNGFQEWTNAVVSGNKVTVTLTDGGEGDADGAANGVILDPIGVAVPADAGGSTDISSTVSTAGGCSVSGSGGGWEETFGSFCLIALVWLGLSLRRRKPGIGA